MPVRPLLLLTFPLLAGQACPAPHPDREALRRTPGAQDLRLTQGTLRLAPAARRLALRLAEPAFRARFDSLLARSNPLALRPIPGTDRGLVAWVPVAAHRAAWREHPRVLVAAWQGGLPLAFGPEGDRHLLDPTRPPRTPVLLLGPAGVPPAAWLPPEPGSRSSFSPEHPGGVPCDSVSSR